MSEMIERVAKAICKSRSCEGFMCCQNPAQMGRKGCPVKAGGYNEAARAAIEAMREPTQAMLDVGTDDAGWGDCEESEISYRWNAMVSAALQPATDTGEAK
jgi:hypothetical protein